MLQWEKNFVCAINSKPQKIGLLAPFVGSPEVEKCEKSQKTKLLQKPGAFWINPELCELAGGPSIEKIETFKKVKRFKQIEKSNQNSRGWNLTF